MSDVKFVRTVEDGCYGRSGHMHLSGVGVCSCGEDVMVRPISSTGMPSSAARFVIPKEDADRVARALIAKAAGRHPPGDDVLVELLRELLAYEKDEFDGDPDRDMQLSGADTIDWLFNFRLRVKDTLAAIGR